MASRRANGGALDPSLPPPSPASLGIAYFFRFSIHRNIEIFLSDVVGATIAACDFFRTFTPISLRCGVEKFDSSLELIFRKPFCSITAAAQQNVNIAMPIATILLSDKGSYREVEIASLPRNVRAAVADMSKRSPSAKMLIDQLGALYRIRLAAPANVCIDVLAVA